MTNSVTDALVEKAARAIYAERYGWKFTPEECTEACTARGCSIQESLSSARIAIAAIIDDPDLIAAGRRQGLEEAAKVVEEYPSEVLQFYSRGPTSPPGNMRRPVIRGDFVVAIKALIPPPGEVK